MHMYMSQLLIPEKEISRVHVHVLCTCIVHVSTIVIILQRVYLKFLFDLIVCMA